MADEDSSSNVGGRRTLAEKLNYLFEVIPGDDGRPQKGNAVVAAVRARGVELSATHLSEIRRGVALNPTYRVLQALADHFGVRVAYLFDDPAAEAEVEAEIQLRAAMRDSGVRDFVMRSAGMPDNQRPALYRLLAEVVEEHAAERKRDPSSGAPDPPDAGPAPMT